MKMRVHMILWSDREIEEKRGTRHVFSMWRGVRVYMLGEIVPE